MVFSRPESSKFSDFIEDFLKTHVLKLSLNLCFKATTTALAQPEASLIHTPQPFQLWPTSLISFSSSLTNAWQGPGALLLHTMNQTPSHCCNLRDLCCKWSLGASMVLATCNWNALIMTIDFRDLTAKISNETQQLRIVKHKLLPQCNG